jgi:uncharacterized protein (TIGR03435 family)
MHQTSRLLIVVAVSTAVAVGQASQRPSFEVASIHPTDVSSQVQPEFGLRIDGAQVRGVNLTFKDYIGIAYRVKPYQISGPEWISSQRFNITATMPRGMPSVTDMLQTLLEERFDLMLHHEKKDFPVYELGVSKTGLKITADPVDPDLEKADAGATMTGTGSNQGVSMSFGRGSSYTFAENRYVAKRLTMTNLAESLERFLDRPIVDATQLKGAYSLTLELTPEDYRAMLVRAALSAGYVLPPEALRAMDDGSFGSLIASLQKLGLALDSRKSPLDLLIIDRVQKSPTEN